MNYYKMVIEANKKIDKMFSEHTPIEVIIFKINTEYGFSDKFIKNRIEKLKAING